MTTTRQPAVAGYFYPDDPFDLRRDVERMLAEAPASTQADCTPPAPEPSVPPRALVLPHAGYVYSGRLAAEGYRLVGEAVRSGAVRRVVVLGPAHRVAVRGVADAGVEAFATPLGDVDVPLDLLDSLRRRFADTYPDLLVTSPTVHAREHSVEVHLPFLQLVAPGVPVLPLVAGDATPEEMGALVAAVLAEEHTLLVVSSDLSHFLPDDEARRVDADTLARVRRAASPLPPRRACGAVPWNGLLVHAAAHGLRASVLDHATSADSPEGDPDRVVGYPAVRYDALGAALPTYARRILEHHLADGPEPAAHPEWADLLAHPWLRRDGASFVTLTTGGRLRGCIGSLEARGPLGADVARNAVAAATRDRRFDPVTARELTGLEIEVSVLSPSEPVPGADGLTTLNAAAATLRPGTDGVILRGDGGRRATFLPQVWEQLADPREFLGALRRKAGLGGGWDPSWTLERYAVDSWEE